MSKRRPKRRNSSEHQPKRLVWGILFDYIVFIEEHRAIALAALRDAEGTSVTWDEAMSCLPADLQGEIRELFDDQELPLGSSRFDFDAIPGAADGDFPFPNQDMLDFLPEKIIAMGEVVETTLNGPRLDIPASAKDVALAVLRQEGWTTTRSDDVIARAVG